MSRLETIDAIILNSRSFFEKDKKCDCIGLKTGIISCLAKYTTSNRSKRKWALEPLTAVRLTVFKGRSFYLINDYMVTESFFQIRSSFNHLQYALFFALIIKKSCTENQPNEHLYGLLFQSLYTLNTLAPLAKITHDFYTSFLKIEGLFTSKDHHNTQQHYLNRISEYIGFYLKPPTQLDDTLRNLVK